MRKEYDLTKLKIKRRGRIKGLHGVPETPEVKTGQVQTMSLPSNPIVFNPEVVSALLTRHP